MSEFNKRAVVELLKSFSKAELREFKKHVGAHGGKSVVNLWNVLRCSHPKYTLLDSDIYKKIRPKELFKDNVYRIWVTELTKLAKEFLAIQAFKEDELLFNNKLTHELLKRRVKKMGQKVLIAHEKQLEKIEKMDSYFYDHCFQHFDISYQYVAMLEQLAPTESLQKAADYLDYSYLVKKLKFLMVMYNRRRIIKEDYIFRLEHQILDYLNENSLEKLPLIHLYYLMLRMIRDLNDHESFNLFIKYFSKNRCKIDEVESRQLTIGALNFCFWNIQLGNLEFLAQRMELAKIMVEEGFVLVEGKMSPYHFPSIINIAIEANDLDWATQFLNNWLPKTPEEHRPDLEAFNRAYLHYAKGEYEAQDEWMLRMAAKDFSFIDVNTEIAFRILRLKTTYTQLGSNPKPLASESFHAQLQSFRNFLTRRPQLPESARASANNFQKALKQLHQKKQGKTLKVGDLRSYILDLQPIRELPWLLNGMESI